MGRFSQLFFARPSVAEGVGRLLDFGGTLSEYNYFADGEMTDQAAIASDWYAVGLDLQTTMEQAAGDLEREK